MERHDGRLLAAVGCCPPSRAVSHRSDRYCRAHVPRVFFRRAATGRLIPPFCHAPRPKMAPTPDSPTRPALLNTTNTHPADATPLFTQQTTGKRATEDADGGDKKRVKLSGTAAADDSSDSDSEVEMGFSCEISSRARRRTVLGMRDSSMAALSFTALRRTACEPTFFQH